MKKSKIYWSYIDTEQQIRAKEPVPIYSNYFKDKDVKKLGLTYSKCPAFREFLHNTFGLKSLYDYDLEFKGEEVSATMHDREFFEKKVLIRNMESRMASIGLKYIMIAEEDSLEMEYLPSFLENNMFNETTQFIPAIMDIGKYVRMLDCAFHCRKNKMEVREDDIYAYIKFKTNNEIELQRFLWTDEINKTILDTNTGLLNYRRQTFKPLDWYYKKQQAIKTKQRVLKLIKENLL
jgi:hypothetical protein